MSEREPIAELAAVIGSGDAALFTGAGFSVGAQDTAGHELPDSAGMVRELWPMLFDEDLQDGSSLADLYDVALLRAPDRLRDYLAARLHVGDAPLPRSFAAWFAAPWRRIYTLNVDDLELAVARQFPLPRRLRSISALAPDSPPPVPGVVDVVHLNGIAGDDPRQVTFSTMQYAARLCTPDREYKRLVGDLRSTPFVFVGTTLDEAVLWQHLELERRTGPTPPRPRSFLIATHLPRARQILLASHRIQWIAASAEHIAAEVLG